MQMRLFISRRDATKSSLDTSIEWHAQPSDKIKKMIIATHISSFLDLYKDYTENDLGLASDLSKEKWLTKMIEDDLNDVSEGKLFLATISLQDTIAGFVICAPTKSRRENLKADVYISILAIKPFRDFTTESKIHIGLGKLLVKAVSEAFISANTITLDTRRINQDAMSFYERIGFSSTGDRTLGGCNPEYYIGYEKPVMRSV